MFAFHTLIQVNPTEFLLCWMQETERQVKTVFAFKELSLQLTGQVHQKKPCPVWSAPHQLWKTAERSTGLLPSLNRQVAAPLSRWILLPWIQAGLGTCLANSSGTSKVELWNLVHSTWVSWSSEQPYMKYNCCGITLPWKDPSQLGGEAAKEWEMPGSLQLLQQCQLHCEWESPSWAQSTHSTVGGPLSTISPLKTSARGAPGWLSLSI